MFCSPLDHLQYVWARATICPRDLTLERARGKEYEMSPPFVPHVRRSMSRLRLLAVILGCVLVTIAAASAPALAKPGRAAQGRVVIQHGQPVQIVVAVDDSGFGASFGPSAREAVQMAVERHPSIRGFAIQINPFSRRPHNRVSRQRSGCARAVRPGVSVRSPLSQPGRTRRRSAAPRGRPS